MASVKLPFWKIIFALACNLIFAETQNISSSGYFAPNSTGFCIQHGFETVTVQPFGYDGFRIRAWPFRPPNGNEISLLYDPRLEGPENGAARGMGYDTTLNGNQSFSLRNGQTVVQTEGHEGGYWRLRFYRVEDDGSLTLLANEYAPLKTINPRYYSWRDSRGFEFEADFSWSATSGEQSRSR
jgi:alpha-D-xyloside xylohydrolase